MYIRSGTDEFCCIGAGSRRFAFNHQVAALCSEARNNSIAAILKEWQIENLTLGIYWKNNPAKIHPDPI